MLITLIILHYLANFKNLIESLRILAHFLSFANASSSLMEML